MDATLYNLTQQTQGQLFYAMRATQPNIVANLPTPPPLFQLRAGYAESPAWFMVQAAEFDPAPLTVANLRVRDIYASERIVQALLELLAGERLLARSGHAYHLTPTGREQLNQLQSRAIQLMNPAKYPLPLEQINRLDSLLHRLIQAALQTNHTWCLAHSRNRAPANNAPPLLKINQYFSDFNAFRDDAHMAAWQSHQIDGYIWEAFALIYTDQANSAATLFDQLIFRGYTQEEYANALQQLADRNWLALAREDTYTVTETGHTIYNKAEATTNTLFYTPWSTLTTAETAETETLLHQLHDALKALTT